MAWRRPSSSQWNTFEASLNLIWFEEPLPRNDLIGYARLAASTPVPIAAGEREYGIQPFQRLIDAQAISVVQPDLLRVGGVTGWRAVDRLAVALYVRNDNRRARLVKLIATCGALDLDDPQPAITVMLSDES